MNPAGRFTARWDKMSHPKIGEFVSISFSDRKQSISGLLIDYNDEWTLLKYNPVDYVIDGYVIIRHKNIAFAARGVKEKFKEKIIKLKKITVTDKDKIPISSIDVILKYLSKNFGVFTLYTKSEAACYLGRLESIDDKELILKYLNPEGKWEGKKQFTPNKIRVMEFDNDYINSLKLIFAKTKVG